LQLHGSQRSPCWHTGVVGLLERDGLQLSALGVGRVDALVCRVGTQVSWHAHEHALVLLQPLAGKHAWIASAAAGGGLANHHHRPGSEQVGATNDIGGWRWG